VSYEGKLVGGPLDGKMVKHWKATFRCFEFDYHTFRIRGHTYVHDGAQSFLWLPAQTEEWQSIEATIP
jgi:hypothetical protein